MKRIFSLLFWTLIFLVICLAVDQLLVRVEMPLPVLREVRAFHVDFRSRLLQVGHKASAEMRPGQKGRSAPKMPRAEAGPAREAPVAPSVAENSRAQVKPVASPKVAPSSRYLYVGPQGELCFADSLEEVPSAYRKDAQKLER